MSGLIDITLTFHDTFEVFAPGFGKRQKAACPDSGRRLGREI
ncbi:hypothetical protein [Novosphingobium marinum]|nr:hypothetical protein [Novosphingobium marinum]